MRDPRPEFAEFAERLRSARVKAGFGNPREAARAFRWNENTYKSRENAIRGIPPYSDVKSYAKAFKVPFVWLLTGEQVVPNEEGAPRAADEQQIDNDLPDDSESIQVLVGDLRKVAVQVLRRGDISERAIEAATDALLVALANQPSAHVVRRLKGPCRSDPESQDPARDGRS